MRFNAWHVAVLVVLLIVLFGARKLPEIAKSIGQSFKVFKKEVSELHDDEPSPSSPSPASPPSGPASPPPAGAKDEPPGS
ncbi:MAG: twin-arginine translocase TatA/TatE family subunit [Bifidobacteriaceae bacterium]|jgi:sec-independent protein translocase protein TatA|nr:twin-arginine translocase TatA/TatE family subunit [Bifidobacteriaceae bacterium]